MTPMPETPPPQMNMAAYCLAEGARRTPDKAALLVLRALTEGAAETWTYRELQDAVLRVAGGLTAKGLRPGDRILIRLDNTSAYAILFSVRSQVALCRSRRRPSSPKRKPPSC